MKPGPAKTEAEAAVVSVAAVATKPGMFEP